MRIEVLLLYRELEHDEEGILSSKVTLKTSYELVLSREGSVWVSMAQKENKTWLSNCWFEKNLT